MRNGVKFRVALWAAVGLLIALGWGLYFATADKATPVEPLVNALAGLTQPLVAVIVSYFTPHVGLRMAAVANAATYAMVGLIVETVRTQLRLFTED
jgi:hypothetical protein